MTESLKTLACSSPLIKIAAHTLLISIKVFSMTSYERNPVQSLLMLLLFLVTIVARSIKQLSRV